MDLPEKGVRMKHLNRLTHLVALTVIFVAGCVSQQPQERKEATFTLLHQSNRYGTVTPCGCHANPNGGLDREANAVRMIRQEGQPVFYVDAGNTFVPRSRKLAPEFYADRASAVVDMLNVTGVDVLAPGPTDYELGTQKLIEIAARAKFPFLSTNIHDKDGKTLFQRYVIVEKNGLKIAFVSLTPKEKVSDPRLKVEDPIASVEALMSELSAKSDLIVGLSHLESAADEALAKNTGINIIVGSDPSVSVHRAFWANQGKTLVVDTSDQGQKLGRLDLNLVVPFEGFYSEAAIQENRQVLSQLESEVALKPGNSAVNESLNNFKKTSLLTPLKGGSKYEHGLVELDETRFGKKNQVSTLIISEANRLKKKAVSE